MSEGLLAGAATVLVVSDVTKSVAYYRNALGFAVTFEWGSPPTYACLCRDDVALQGVIRRCSSGAANYA